MSVEDLGERSIEGLGLTPEVEQKLKEIHRSLKDAYAEQYMALLATVKEQATALRRIQETLNILVTAVAPQMTAGVHVPIAVQAASGGGPPDLATAMIVADPMGAGFTMSQADLATALAPGVTAPDISIVVRAFKLGEDPDCAVLVRSGKQQMVNYHPKTVGRLRELVAAPPKSLTPSQRKAADRILRRIREAETMSSS